MTARLFVVEDDADHAGALCDLMQAAGHDATAFSSAAAALAALTDPPDLILSDLRMPGMDGLGLLRAIRALPLDLPVILLTGHGDIGHAVQAIRAGADDFLEKPYDAAHLIAVVARALAARATRAEVGRLQQVLAERAEETLLGQSRALSGLRDRIAALAPLEVDVVITGETGTGKELAARALHAGGARAHGPFVAINCAALPEAMADLILFGHAAGAFPGAAEARAGKLEAAQGGTLMLDEVESMPPPVQAKLLRALQDRSVERLGENGLRPVDLRVIATSKADLRNAPGFRADLYYRLAGATLRTPPLREAGEDIPLIFAHYAQRAARRYGRPDPALPFALTQHLKRRAWPGNMRELKAAAEAHALGLFALSPAEDAGLPEGTLAERVAAFEAREIAAALDRHRDNTLRVAEKLGLPRRTLNDKMRRYGLS
ncbi:sigma-54 dependent transcriptional regulator [Pseudorhodobacter sp. MZDSW-24AT]|uniref:sigma-54-dependent transcriptional regulator n=1 Tax=Pseudorhodobacter sp. MZDSW-24AT TaxID=2052957 RepID=UPI000C1EFA32|nr:sigma-54 dependent transcriptional regulator [Pseudorhodobacter sp. MZDSW-24AT]PJF08787.1 sigma-54-dependent Fis family transcriptional regulator [Pseudorhodobacter sp. MZDSW-24AT]